MHGFVLVGLAALGPALEEAGEEVVFSSIYFKIDDVHIEAGEEVVFLLLTSKWRCAHAEVVVFLQLDSKC